MKDGDLMFLIHQQPLLMKFQISCSWSGNSSEDNYNKQQNEERLVCSLTLKRRFPNHPVTNHEIHLCFKSLGSASLSHCRDDSSQVSSSMSRIWTQVGLTLTSLRSSF